MTNVLANHRVKDYQAWKSVFDNFIDFRRASGEKSYRILHPANDTNNLTIIFEWDSLENAEKFMNSTKLKSTMHEAGVIDAPNIQFFEEAEQGTL